ncbi:TylF/MycF family methyltransferase [Pseudofrankia sp. DC12]|uniref:TylF/MycF family methyltransferase n=1 Tax=Pseudofrankia sp. DC12 TaxID=683315 RepID=UPI000A4EE805|nr:TylF/MycF family methyltransferase [Pseudofrankia sp. DC12]
MTLAPQATARAADLYLDLMKRVLPNTIYRDAPIPNPIQPVHDYDSSRRATGQDWPSVAHTMVGRLRLDNVQECITTVIGDGIPGDLVETGVWRGGTVIFMRAVLRAFGVTDRSVWAVDSFEGMPVTGEDGHDLDRQIPWHMANHVMAISLEQVQANFEAYGLLDDQVRFLKGWFADTLPTAPIERIAVLRLDGDLYASTMDALTNLYHKVSPGGFVIIDDYHLHTCKEAVHDFRAARSVTEPMEQIDQDAVFWRLPATA